MATADSDLAPPPPDERARALWLQHAAGFILFEDVRRYARDRIDPGLHEDAREAALKAIDDAPYGLMMVVDGVTGVLESRMRAVRLNLSARLTANSAPVQALDLREKGDGMCMGHHGWCEGDFGVDPMVTFPLFAFQPLWIGSCMAAFPPMAPESRPSAFGPQTPSSFSAGIFSISRSMASMG